MKQLMNQVYIIPIQQLAVMAEELLAVDQNGNTYNTKIFINSNHINNSKRQSINGKEFDTYRVGVEKNSCSTMHKIADKEFTLDDFSCEHLNREPYYRDWIKSVIVDEDITSSHKVWMTPLDILRCTIEMLNAYRKSYLETKDKQDWWQMIQLLPSSYNQRRTIMLNYEVLTNIYKSRRNHKLDEWHTFCDWIEDLPYSELITGKEINND